MRLHRPVELTPGEPGIGMSGAGAGIEANMLEPGNVDHYIAVAQRVARDIMATGAHGNEQILGAGEFDRPGHIGSVAAAHDEGWAAVDHSVVEFPGRFVARIAWPAELSAELGFQLAEGSHSVPPYRKPTSTRTTRGLAPSGSAAGKAERLGPPRGMDVKRSIPDLPPLRGAERGEVLGLLRVRCLVHAGPLGGHERAEPDGLTAHRDGAAKLVARTVARGVTGLGELECGLDALHRAAAGQDFEPPARAGEVAGPDARREKQVPGGERQQQADRSDGSHGSDQCKDGCPNLQDGPARCQTARGQTRRGRKAITPRPAPRATACTPARRAPAG